MGAARLAVPVREDHPDPRRSAVLPTARSRRGALLRRLDGMDLISGRFSRAFQLREPARTDRLKLLELDDKSVGPMEFTRVSDPSSSTRSPTRFPRSKRSPDRYRGGSGYVPNHDLDGMAGVSGVVGPLIFEPAGGSASTAIDSS
jgi:hypothetical protein